MAKNRLNAKTTKLTAVRNLHHLIREFELIYNLSPKLTKAQIVRLKLLFNQIVKEKSE